MLGREIETDEEGNQVLDEDGNIKTFSAYPKDLYKIARYADDIEDYGEGADRLRSDAAAKFANDHYFSRVTDSNGDLTNNYYSIRVNAPRDKNEMVYRGVKDELDTQRKQGFARDYFDISALPDRDWEK